MKNLTKSIVEEFEQRMFDESFDRIKKCLDLIEENDLWTAPNKNITSIGSTIQHIIGNSTQWIISTLGGQVDQRTRSSEFEKSSKTIDDLLGELEEQKSKLRAVINSISEDQLSESYSVQYFNVTGFSIIVHVIEHTSYHTGQISLLTKLFVDDDLGYYDGFDLE